MPNGQDKEERERLLQALEKSIAVISTLLEQADEMDTQAKRLEEQAQELRSRAATTRTVAQAARSVLANVAEAHYGESDETS